MSLPPWPPAISDDARNALLTNATNYALANSVLFAGPNQESPLATAFHAPFALFPSPFPRRLFNEAVRIQKVYNVLYARVSTDYEFLNGVITEIGDADPFVLRLWSIFQQCLAEGLAQPIHMGLVRSDYLLHDVPDTPLSMRQVEFNAIGCAFGPHSQHVVDMHRYLFDLTGYCDSSPLLKAENLQPNHTTKSMALGLAEGHRLYKLCNSSTGVSDSANYHAWILFVISDKESNIFDQRSLEYELVQTHKIRVIRQTYEDLMTNATLDPDTRVLRVQTPYQTHPVEISVVYFRAGWAPSSFPTDAHFDIRATLERSQAIKCPSLPFQLSGSKKVQQVLASPGILEAFLTSPKYGTAFDQADVDAIRNTFAQMNGLADIIAERGMDEVKRLGASKQIVLKPQREGGGNNVYGVDIPPFLDALPVDERKAWITMEMISVPRGVRNWLVRAGVDSATGLRQDGAPRAVNEEIVSELGIFGAVLFRQGQDGVGETVALYGEEAGYLLRTKEIVNNEGGVGVGFSVLDSVVLVDV